MVWKVAITFREDGNHIDWKLFIQLFGIKRRRSIPTINHHFDSPWAKRERIMHKLSIIFLDGIRRNSSLSFSKRSTKCCLIQFLNGFSFDIARLIVSNLKSIFLFWIMTGGDHHPRGNSKFDGSVIKHGGSNRSKIYDIHPTRNDPID